MAQTPSFNPTIDPISFNPKPVVSGVKDKGSTMSMLAGLGSLTAEGIANYQEQSAYEDVDKLSADLTSQYELQSPTLIAETQEDINKVSPFIAQAQLGMTPAFGSEQEAQAFNQEYSKVEETYREKLNFLQRAQEQGKMSPEQFAMRAKELTKSVIARNPHLSKELLSRLSTNLSSSGIQERMQLDEQYYKSIQKQQDFRLKEITENLGTFGANIFMFKDSVTGEFDLPKAERFLIEKGKNLVITKELEQDLKNTKTVDDATLLAYKRSGVFGKVTDVYANNYSAAALEAVNSGGDVDQILTSLRFSIDENNRRIDVGFSQLSDDPDVKSAIENTKKYGESVYNALKSSLTKEGATQLAQNINTLNNITETDEVRAALGGNIKKFEMLQLVLSNPYFSSLVKENQFDEMKNLLITYGLQLNGLRLGSSSLEVNPATGVSDFTSLNTSQTNVVASGQYDEAFVGSYNNQISDRHKAVTSVQSPQQKFNDVQQLLSEYASDEFAKAAAVVNPELKQEALTLIRGQSIPLGKGIQGLEDNGVEFGFTDEGLLQITNGKGTNKDLVNFIDRVNTNLKAFANLSGTSTKNASKSYFETFYNDVFKPETLVNAEEEYKTVAGSLTGKVKQLERIPLTIPSYKVALDKASPGSVTMPDSSASSGVVFAMQPDNTRRPSYGITPVDYTKTGKALDQEKDRYRQEFLTQMLLKYDGDERKAIAAYVSGPEEVDKAISKAAKRGEAGLWVESLPANAAKAVAESKVVTSKDVNALDNIIPKLREKQEAIRKANPQEYDAMFEKGTGVALAKDIAKDLSRQGIDMSWNAVFDYMANNNLLPEEEQQFSRESTGKLTPAQEGVDEATRIKQRYASLYEEQKRLFNNKVITKEEFGERASKFNRMMKEELAARNLK